MLIDLTKRILKEHVDPNTEIPEVILLGYCDNEVAGEHLSRYLFASKHVYGVVLDCGAGSCYGSSILRRANSVRFVVSVDIDEDVLQYGRKVFGANCVRVDVSHLPFLRDSFDSVVCLEVLEHVKDQNLFLRSLAHVLKKGGNLIVSTPNKLYSSPFLPKALNPYHTKEHYLGSLLRLLESNGFIIDHIYGGGKITHLELIRRIFGSLTKFLLSKVGIKPFLIDKVYHAVMNPKKLKKRTFTLVDPDPKLFPHDELKTIPKMPLYRYFLIRARKL